MIVCDICKDVKKNAFPCFASLSKEEEKRGKIAEREMKRFTFHLCEDCITDTIARIGRNLPNTPSNQQTETP